MRYRVHGHLYSPVAFLNHYGSPLERYEYGAYGEPTIYTDKGNDGIWLTADDVIGTSSAQDNFYLFTGRRVDILDNGSLKIQYNRNRYYDYYTGRWLTHDPLGINPAGGRLNPFSVGRQYADGMNLYQYARSNPVIGLDGFGHVSCRGCRAHWDVYLWVGPDPDPEDRPRVGETTFCEDSFNVALSVTRSNCEPGCRRLRIQRCTCHIRGWYYHPPRWWMYDRGRHTPKQHEIKHSKIIGKHWSTITDIAKTEQTAECMCRAKAECFRDAFNDLFVPAVIKRCDAENYQFDCDMYPEGTPDQEAACDLAATREAEAANLMSDFLNKWLDCYEM